MNNPTPAVVSRAPDELVMALASGLKSDLEIAKQFGMDVEQLQAMMSDPELLAEVGKKHQMLEADGHFDAAKLRLIFMDLARKSYIAMHGPDATPMQMMQLMKTIGPYTRLEPRKEETASAAPAMMINITVNGKRRHSLTLDGSATAVEEGGEALPAHLAAFAGVADRL